MSYQLISMLIDCWLNEKIRYSQWKGEEDMAASNY